MSDDAVDLISNVIEDLVAQFAPLIRATCRRFDISDQESEELAQDVRIRLWRVIAHGAVAVPSTSYCQRVVVSAAADIARRRRCGRVSSYYGVDPGACAASSADGMPNDPGPALLLERHELEGAIEASVSALAPPRDVVVRLYLAGSDRTEIAELLGWSEPKVRNLLYRGLRDLRVVLVERGVAPGMLT